MWVSSDRTVHFARTMPGGTKGLPTAQPQCSAELLVEWDAAWNATALQPNAFGSQRDLNPRSKRLRCALLLAPHPYQAANRLLELVQVLASATLVQMHANLDDVVVG
jgi:hypothetical protein